MKLSMFFLASIKSFAPGKIRFVPVDWPAAIESGGHVKYVLQICRFDQTIAAVVGSLAFTVVPVLPKDCSPPQVLKPSDFLYFYRLLMTIHTYNMQLL